jgi:hypothetical protein
VTPEAGSVRLVTEAVPDTTDHVPVSETATALAAIVAVVVLQRFWSGPALDTVMARSTLIITVSEVGAHPPNSAVIVHAKVEELPMANAVIVEFGSLRLVTTAVPDTTNHVPVSLSLVVLAARLVVVVLQRS